MRRAPRLSGIEMHTPTTEKIDFHPPSEAAASILPPLGPLVFAARAERFAALAAGHSLGDWLAFLSRLTRAQHDALLALPELPLPAAAVFAQARAHAMPPLNAAALPRPAAWRAVLLEIADALAGEAPESARRIFAELRAAPAECLEKMAGELLAGNPDPQDAAALPFVAAALQVVWTALAGRIDADTLGTLDTPGVCPCCGSLPVASVVRLGASINNLRYLHCSLCNTEWNVPRATCTACGTDKEVAQQQIEGTDGAVRAETCDSCKSYLKIVYQEKDRHVDPVADDLATLALDMLVDAAGYGRSGPNLLLVGGGGQNDLPD